jgi:hypothetical protein
MHARLGPPRAPQASPSYRTLTLPDDVYLDSLFLTRDRKRAPQASPSYAYASDALLGSALGGGAFDGVTDTRLKTLRAEFREVGGAEWVYRSRCCQMQQCVAQYSN